jgi:hypothetical protein
MLQRVANALLPSCPMGKVMRHVVHRDCDNRTAYGCVARIK